MEDLTLEGEVFSAVFQDTKKEDDSKTHVYTCWKTSPHMWWEGKVKITNRVTEKEVRAFFETYHRSNVPEGIINETLEQSLLLIRGKDEKGNYISHRDGGSILFNRVGAIDYLLGLMYVEAATLAEEIIFPKIHIPLLEQHDLAERGYALEEPTRIKSH